MISSEVTKLDSEEVSASVHPVARTQGEWETLLVGNGEPKFRAQQVFEWIHKRGVFAPDEMTNLSKRLRALLEGNGLSAPCEVEEVQRSLDGTRKILLKMAGELRVECVLIPMSTADERDADLGVVDEEEDEGLAQAAAPRDRVTLCISTQVGCAMGCVFCASGKAGLTRGLTAAEVVAQVLIAKRYLDPGEHLRNLVFMGMGEPLHHYAQTKRAIELITTPNGLGMSPRRITVSTVGLVPGIRKLGEDFGGKLGLAVSLHAPDNATRDKILPMNKRYDVDAILGALRRYPLPKRRRITIEYTLVGGINDSVEHASKLASVLKGLAVKVNLIPMNPIEGSDLKEPTSGGVEAFRLELGRRRVSCSVRQRRGDDVDAACGQLALKRQGLIQLGSAPEVKSGAATET